MRLYDLLSVHYRLFNPTAQHSYRGYPGVKSPATMPFALNQSLPRAMFCRLHGRGARIRRDKQQSLCINVLLGRLMLVRTSDLPQTPLRICSKPCSRLPPSLKHRQILFLRPFRAGNLHPFQSTCVCVCLREIERWRGHL